MGIILAANGIQYSQFSEISVQKSLAAIGGSFEFVCASDDLTGFPVPVYSNAVCSVDGVNIITGYVTKIITSYDTSSHTVNIIGTDRAIDVVDCSVVSNTQYKAPISIAELAERVIADSGLEGIGVVDKSDSGQLRDPDEISAETGKGIFEFLDEYAKKQNVVLTSDGDGNIVVFRNAGFNGGARLENKKGSSANKYIISASGTTDVSKRFSSVSVRSQGGLSGFFEFAADTADVENIEGASEDSAVQRNRPRTIIAQSANDAKGCQEQATWEVNKRRSDSIIYTTVKLICPTPKR